jgi:transcriptional regulator with XRE-family HTH domain
MPLDDQPADVSGDLAAIGRRIQDCRRAAGLSQDQLAEQIGIGRRQVQRIENGRADPRLSWLARIARVVDVPLTDLVDLSEDAWQPPPANKPRRWYRRPAGG